MRPKSSERRDSPKRDNNADQAPSADVPITASHGWRPDQAGRHDSPLYGHHRKRPIPIDSNANSDAASTSPKKQASPPRHQEVSKRSALDSAALHAASLSVQPPRTPQGASHSPLEADGGLSAAQRVRMELSGSRAGSGSRSNSSEDVFSHTASSPVYDEKKNGPRSCPSTFNDVTKVSPGRRRQLRSGELVVSKLLPTRDSVNSLLTYLHELQISEASLRKQLVTTKRHTEEELYQSISKLNELQRTIEEVERDRQLAQQRLEEKEQRIRELSAKLEQAETRQGRRSPVRSSISVNDEMSLLPRGAASSMEAQTRTVTTANSRQKSFQEGKTSAFQAQEPLPLTMEALLPSTPPRQPSRPSLQPLQLQTIKQQAADFESMSPRSPNRPLWDPWASGGATPMKNLPPVFTIGGTGLDPMVTSSTLADQESATTTAEDYELKSVLMSPRHAQGQDEGYGNGHEKRQGEQQESPLLEPQYAAQTSTVGSIPPSQPQDFYPTEMEDASYATQSLEETPLVEEFPSHLDPMLHIGAMPPIHESPYEERSPTPTGCAQRVEWPDGQSQQETQASAARLPLAATLVSHEASSPTLGAESFPEALLPQAPVAESSQAPAAHTHEPDHDTRNNLVATAEPEIHRGDSSVLHNPPTEASPLKLPAVNDVPKPLPASPSRKEEKAVPAEPVSLEALLVDFFTEVDKKRLKMAKVYGKRYAGREKWLFAELTKRYGAAKVSMLKARLETGCDEASSVQSQEEVPLLKLPSPMLPIETMPQTGENSFERQKLRGTSAEEGVPDAYAPECYGVEGQQELPPPAASLVPPVGPGMESSAGADSSFADNPTVLPPPTASVEDEQSQYDASQTAVPFNESVQSQEVPHTENVAASVPAAPPVGSSPPPPASEVSKPLPASPALKEKKAAPAEPVSLETLLVDFFTEVDKKRLKMAKVYGKRYAGREKWLFAELTKRYGAAKVLSLKARLETGSSAAAATTSNANTAKVQSNTNSTAASDQSKPARQGHPRHPQFFHPTAPANSVDLSGDVATGPPQVPPPLVLPQENDNANTQGQQAAEGFVAPPSPSGKMSPGRAARVSPRPRRSGGTIPPFGGPPPPFSLPQGTDGSSSAVSGGMDGLPVMNDPPPSTQQNQPPSGQFNQPPPPQNDMDTSNAAPMGLRQRHNASAPTAQGQKTSSAGPPSVTLEGLLKELYKKHQPDKLKNVAIVAKQYAGKERELVGLLKGKYGALSVKRLEENLEVLERAYRERTGSKGFDKKRGCFVRTISLLFWLSVLLYFSLGAVFVSFVMLDAWECRALDIEEQEQELESGECAPLKKELDAFTYERVGDYVTQSHPEACFCSEWKARESALLSNLSGEDLVNLARLVPFSPDSFGEPWIATVKEQIPSQEFYESYAKPVVDLSLDLGSFVWSSALELAGYDEASQKETGVKEDVVENDTTDLPSLDHIDVDMDSLELPSEAVEKEMFADDESVGDHLAAGVEAEVDSFEMADVVESEQGPVEEEASTSEEELQLGEVDVATEVDVKVAGEEGAAQVEEKLAVRAEEETAVPVEEETAVPVEEEAAPVDEDSYPLASETNDEESVGESLRELESEDAQLTEETEPVEDAQPIEETVTVGVTEEEPFVVPETEVEEVSADDSIINTSEDNESVGGDDDEASFSTETKVSDVAAEDASEAAGAETDEIFGEDVAAASDDVVEVEVRQEGLDMSYPEAETDAVDDTLSADPTTNAASSHADEDPELVRTDDAEVPSVSNEEEAEVAEFGDASAEFLEEESESVERVTSEDSDASASIEEVDVGAPHGSSQVETDQAQADSSDFEDLNVDTSVDAVKPAATAGDCESSAPIDVDAPVLVLEEVVDSLREESELDRREDDAVTLMKTEPHAASPSNDEGVSTSHDNLFNVEEEEISVAAEAETELSSGSSDDTAVGLLVEENVVASLGEPAAGDDEGGSNDSAPVEEQHPVSEDDDASLDESVSVVFSIDDVDESAIPAVDDAMAPELELEEVVADVPSDEEVEQELADESFSESLQQKGDVNDDIVATALKTETTGEQSGAISKDKFASPIEAAEENVWEEERFTVDDVEMDVTSTRGLGSSMNVGGDEDDSEEDEEIAFMEELEDPDEVLRMAEQAAAAELSAMESR